MGASTAGLARRAKTGNLKRILRSAPLWRVGGAEQEILTIIPYFPWMLARVRKWGAQKVIAIPDLLSHCEIAPV